MINRFLMGPLLEEASGDGSGAGGGEKNPGLDAKAIQGLIDNSINGFAKRFEGDIQKKFGAFSDQLSGISKLLEKNGSQGNGEGDGAGEGDQGNKGKQDGSIPPVLKAQLDTQAKIIDKLNKRLSDTEEREKAAASRAEETERNSAIRAELSKYPILPEAVDEAFDLFRSRVKRSEDGTLVVGDTTAEAHIKSALEGKLAGLLRPADKGGAGSSAGQRTGKLDLNEIKPGMSKETEAQALAEIARLLPHGA